MWNHVGMFLINMSWIVKMDQIHMLHWATTETFSYTLHLNHLYLLHALTFSYVSADTLLNMQSR